MRKERIHELNNRTYLPGRYVLYRMQASVRIRNNQALFHAIRLANELNLPLKVVFRLDASFPEANYRHFEFLIQGLKDFASGVSLLGCEFEIRTGTLEEAFLEPLSNAACVVTDKGYLRIQRDWSGWLGEHAPCKVIEVEDNLIVPVESASHKGEWAARTLRPKITDKLPYFTSELEDEIPVLTCRKEASSELSALNERILTSTLEKLRSDAWLIPVAMKGGEQEANRLLDVFVKDKLASYDNDRNDPSLVATSRLSAYLHFGFISPVEIWKAVEKYPESAPFIEQLVVRRELAHNYIWFTKNYDSYNSLPEWSRKSLELHEPDKRPFVYDLNLLEEAATHDASWNAAMREMIQTGFMENTMRMYWGKKLIEWSATPQEAYHRMSYLNNRYFLDGRDANSFTGIGWCFGLHDRPWQERPVFGMVRYMNEAGLYRKYNMNAYIGKWS